MKIELHIIQNFAPSNLNRDEFGVPKDTIFGGFRRARISSQCLKRSIRSYWDEKELLLGSRGILTKTIADKTAKLLESEKRDYNIAQSLVADVINNLYKIKFKKSKENKELGPSYSLYLSYDAVSVLKEEIQKHWDLLTSSSSLKSNKDKGDNPEDDENETTESEPDKKSKKIILPEGLKKSIDVIFDQKRNVDVSMFGRMITDNPALNVESACCVAHAISTHKVDMGQDFFVTLDDLKSEPGAAMMGLMDFNSSCYYRYSNLDTQQLINNLGGNKTLFLASLEAFFEAAIKAVPSGKQHASAAFCQPSFVFVVIKKDKADYWSLVNAFEKPVPSTLNENDSIIEQSILKLDEYWGKMVKSYGKEGISNTMFYSLNDIKLKNIDTKPFEGMKTLISQILTNIREEEG